MPILFSSAEKEIRMCDLFDGRLDAHGVREHETVEPGADLAVALAIASAARGEDGSCSFSFSIPYHSARAPSLAAAVNFQQPDDREREQGDGKA